MTLLQYLFSIVFSFLLLVGCSQTDDHFIGSIDAMTILPGEHTFQLFINDERVGTNNMVIQNGFYISFGNNIYDRVTKIDETISINSSTETMTTFTKDIDSDGYYYLSDEVSGLTTPYIQFPIAYSSELYGPFSAISTENYRLNVTMFHETYTNKLGFEFANVIEAEGVDGLIKLFFNNEFFIIQKEDFRYQTTIQSLDLNYEI